MAVSRKYHIAPRLTAHLTETEAERIAMAFGGIPQDGKFRFEDVRDRDRCVTYLASITLDPVDPEKLRPRDIAYAGMVFGSLPMEDAASLGIVHAKGRKTPQQRDMIEHLLSQWREAEAERPNGAE